MFGSGLLGFFFKVIENRNNYYLLVLVNTKQQLKVMHSFSKRLTDRPKFYVLIILLMYLHDVI